VDGEQEEVEADEGREESDEAAHGWGANIATAR
jgi:hypothetical protein